MELGNDPVDLVQVFPVNGGNAGFLSRVDTNQLLLAQKLQGFPDGSPCLGVIFLNISRVPESLAMIVRYAFQPAPAAGGFLGSTVSLTMARGASRGIFSNEAGMGTATTVHATAQTDDPVHQGMYGILEVFIVSIIICTLTALTVITSGVWDNGNTGVVMAFDAFRGVWGKVWIIVLSIADMAVGFIVIPNMIALFLLSPEFFKRFKDYRNKIKKETQK